MNSYIVTGGAGFIGSHLVRELLRQGNSVIAIDNLLTGSEKNLEEFYSNTNFAFLNHDLISGMPNINGDIKGVFHMASPASPNAKSARSYIAHPIETLLVNSIGTKNILEFAKRNNSVVVYASSSEIYGDPDRSPQKEDYWGNVSSVGPRSVYDEGKRFGEAICAAYARTYNVDTRTIRIFNTYGDHMQKDDGRVVSNFISQALANEEITVYGEGQQTRSFCFIDDLVNGLIAVMEKEGLAGEVYNLGNPDEHTINEIATKIKEMTQSNSEIVHEELPVDDPKQRRPDITKAKEAFGFEPKVNLDEGLRRTIEYFKKV